jgi:hypothetical protein
LGMYRAIIGIPRGETARVKKVCSDIKMKNPSFIYEIFSPTVPKIREKFENLLFLDSYSEEDVMRWAGWFVHLCKNAKVSDYFWVKKV